VIHRRTGVRWLIDVDWIIPEESAHGVPLSFSNQSLESFRVNSDGVPVRQFPSSIFVAVHYFELHGGFEGSTDASHSAGAKVLAQPIGSFQILLPGGVAGKIFVCNVVSLAHG
jgi:hypothetical protein